MKNRGFQNEAVRNSLWEILSKLIEKSGAIVFTIILARFLLPEGFGIYSLTLAVALFFISAIDYTLDTVSIRYVSNALASNGKKDPAAYFRYIFKIKFILIVCSSISLLLLSYPLAVYFFKKSYLFAPLFISSFYIFILSITNHYESIFYTIKRVKGRVIKTILQQSLRIGFSLLAFFLVARAYYVLGILTGLILTTITVLIFIFVYLKKFTPFMFEKTSENVAEKKKIKKFAVYLFVTSILGLLLMYIDIFMIGYFIKEIKYLGLYSGAISLIWGITGFLNFALVFLPILTQIKKERLNDVINRVVRFTLMISIPASLGIFAMSRYIIVAIYGWDYIDSAIILQALSFLVIEMVNSSLISTLLTAREKPEYITKISFLTLGLSIILNFSLINLFLKISPLYAILGAAIATSLARYFAFFVILSIAKKKLNISIKKESLIKPVFAALLMLAAIELINRFIIKDMNIFTGIIEILIGAGVYFGVLYLIKGVGKEDLKIIKNGFVKQDL